MTIFYGLDIPDFVKHGFTLAVLFVLSLNIGFLQPSVHTCVLCLCPGTPFINVEIHMYAQLLLIGNCNALVKVFFLILTKSASLLYCFIFTVFQTRFIEGSCTVTECEKVGLF